MRFSLRIATAVCGAALVPAAVMVSAAATPANDEAEVTAVADALGVSAADARERLAQQAEAHQVLRELSGELDGELVGHWFDARAGRLTVAVTSDEAAGDARAAGAQAKVVARDEGELQQLMAKVERLAARVPGVTSYGPDVVHNGVRVNVTGEASPRVVAQLRALDGVRVISGAAFQQQEGQIQPGTAWYDTGGKCSMGFAATDADGGNHFVTAGHCMVKNPDDPAFGDSAKQDRIGTANVGGRAVNNNEGDMGAVAVTEPGWELSAEVNTHGDADPFAVTGSVDAQVGDAICQSGDTTGFKCGEVTAVNQTVDFGGGVVVEGLSFGTPCTDFGDSGGAWIAGDKAAGTHSGGVGVNNCKDGEDNAAFQPVNEELTKFGLTLYTGSAA